MIRNFNISLTELLLLDINFVYDMIYYFRREEKSRDFLKMSLAGIDIFKMEDYKQFVKKNIKEKPVDMSDMEDIKDISLKLLKGGKNG